MAQADDSRIAKLDQITIDAVVRAAGRGLLTPTEAGLLINRLRTHLATSPSSIQDGFASGESRRTGNRPAVDPDGTVL